MNSAAVFFTDRDLGRKFPEILRTASLRVERHADHFQHDTPDEEWLAHIGDRGWIALTHNGRIRYKPNELTGIHAYRQRPVYAGTHRTVESQRTQETGTKRWR